MSDKEFLDLEVQVKNLIKLSKQLKESNIHLLKKNKSYLLRNRNFQKHLLLQQKILKDSLKILKKRRSNLNGKEYYKSKNFRSGI